MTVRRSPDGRASVLYAHLVEPDATRHREPMHVDGNDS